MLSLSGVFFAAFSFVDLFVVVGFSVVAFSVVAFFSGDSSSSLSPSGCRMQLWLCSQRVLSLQSGGLASPRHATRCKGWDGSNPRRQRMPRQGGQTKE